jgi:hypothetical protein
METENTKNSNSPAPENGESKQGVDKILKNEKPAEQVKRKRLPNIGRVRDRDPKQRIDTR